MRSGIFETIRAARDDKKFSADEVTAIDALLDTLGVPRVTPVSGSVTIRVVLETVEHESIVQEAYKDSVGVWTWSVGLTAASGVDPLPYKDKPAPLSVCLAAAVERMRNKYGPEVTKAFRGRVLTEAQFAAALSWHWNTGAIGRTDWVTLFLDGKVKEARSHLEGHYLNGGDLKERRLKEAALFFDGKWTQTGMASVVPVAKPSYQPNFRLTKRVNIMADLALALAS